MREDSVYLHTLWIYLSHTLSHTYVQITVYLLADKGRLCISAYIVEIPLTHSLTNVYGYGVATIGRLLKIIGLFCERALQKRLYFAKETCNFKEPTNRSHPIVAYPLDDKGRIRISAYIADIPLTHTLTHIYR